MSSKTSKGKLSGKRKQSLLLFSPRSKEDNVSKVQKKETVEKDWGSRIHSEHRTKQPTRTFPIIKLNPEIRSESGKDLLWIDKHSPWKCSDLAVSAKKVKQVSLWLQEHTRSNIGGLLILIGGPGVGKSTLIHCLCRELGLDIVEWTETFYSSPSKQQQQPLQTLSPLQQFQQFLQQNSIGYSSLTSNSESSFNKIRKKIILMDELPHCHTEQAKESMRERFTNHILTTVAVPTVWIWSSNVLEGKRHNPLDLEAILHPQVLYNPQYCTLCTIPPPTATKFHSALLRIAQLERIHPLPKSWISQIHNLTTTNGDLRWAIHAMQYEFGSPPLSFLNKDKTAGHSNDQQSPPSATMDRDVRLNPFHALGKLLYAKRKNTVGSSHSSSHDNIDSQRFPLEFDPETVLEQSSMELWGSFYFLQYHSLDFFTDVTEVSVAWDLFSDADLFLAAHQTEATSSLISRAVAYSNRHPQPNRFRQFAKPKSLSVTAQHDDNQRQLDQLYYHYYYYYSNLQQPPDSKHDFAMDIYPYGRRIVENRKKCTTEDCQLSLFCRDSLQSIVNISDNLKTKRWETPTHENNLGKEQEEILKLDDIVEFEDNLEN